ncbi:Na+/H+ antiporter subunit E [Salinimicrobium xinjiangense]|uniref:Na+/H+ antiporter subunit E n=1 Tax=Salinimicrobium xinjiangense TaxID=438596 RepID=UPI0004248610|nr:Na+/H+ antiporter subunit E [Salinimicrobium xinjiangense]
MKTRFLANLLLTILWVAVTGTFEPANVLFGFFLSFFLLWMVTRGTGKKSYFKLVPRVISFFFFFLYELVKANLEVAYEVSTPKLNMKPGIVALPLDVKSDFGITLLANLITLTPGTLSLDVSEDKKIMYVHSMYIYDKQEFIKGIKNGFEKRIIEISS